MKWGGVRHTEPRAGLGEREEGHRRPLEWGDAQVGGRGARGGVGEGKGKESR